MTYHGGVWRVFATDAPFPDTAYLAITGDPGHRPNATRIAVYFDDPLAADEAAVVLPLGLPHPVGAEPLAVVRALDRRRDRPEPERIGRAHRPARRLRVTTSTVTSPCTRVRHASRTRVRW